eukprot:TRINITY_DN27314_c0_g1_i1.p1 TRINITY_DN27314_c0_g1~~TRINITY_DN27314_c0_g1_i1.p1  ORF type:complete len:269 (-),score=43.07 TRINITY_DN27314_c0_g1_i1:118-924(-)
MEFPYDLASLVGAPSGHDGPCVGLIDERVLRAESRGLLCNVIEEMGKRSASAQGLRKPVTSGTWLGDHRLYLLVDGRVALGLLKVGRKRLFVEAGAQSRADFADVKAAFREIEPLCALDFYVHERCQRAGFGRQLFDTMLAREQVSPEQLGYDRPSPKLLGFLKKHFGLSKYRPQNNNFVVFDAFFDPHAEETRSSSRCDRSVPRGTGAAVLGRDSGSGSCRQATDRGSGTRHSSAGVTRGGGQGDLFSGRSDHHPLHYHRRAAAPIF